jgi:hypothetical protein
VSLLTVQPIINASASEPHHDHVITRRKVTENDPRLPVAHAARGHSHFVPDSVVSKHSKGRTRSLENSLDHLLGAPAQRGLLPPILDRI